MVAHRHTTARAALIGFGQSQMLTTDFLPLTAIGEVMEKTEVVGKQLC